MLVVMSLVYVNVSCDIIEFCMNTVCDISQV